MCVCVCVVCVCFCQGDCPNSLSLAAYHLDQSAVIKMLRAVTLNYWMPHMYDVMVSYIVFRAL